MSWRARSSSGFEAFRSELERHRRPGTDLVVLRSVDSTNAFARGRLEDARRAAAPSVVVAWEQTEGRGRRGRRWESPPGGGLYASLVLPLADREALETLPLALPVELCRSLEALGVSGCGLKWPNDLIVDGRKLAGLLIEAVSRGQAPVAAIVGIGVNYELQESARLGRTAVDLAELVEPLPSLAEVARRLFDPLVERLVTLAVRARLVDAYRALSVHRTGEPLSCRTASETVEGVFAGFDERGYLCLTGAAGERRIAAGEIVER